MSSIESKVEEVLDRFAADLMRYRAMPGKSNTVIADESGISYRTVDMIINRRCTPDLKTMLKISVATNVKVML